MSQQSDNVIRVAFSGTAWENQHAAPEDEVDPDQEIRAIIQCLRYLQEQAGRIERTDVPAHRRPVRARRRHAGLPAWWMRAAGGVG